MRFTRTALTVVGASALLLGSLAAPAMADTDLAISGGTTQVTTTANTLQYLTKHGILMSPTNGATSTVIGKAGTARQQFGFAVTESTLKLEDNTIGGRLGSITGGRLFHTGGIKFLNSDNGKQMKLGDLVINFGQMKVYARSLNGDPITPVAVFTVKPIDPPLVPVYNDQTTPTKARIPGVSLRLTGGAAALLNDMLKTKVFAKDLKFGKAASKVDLVQPL